MTISLFLSCKKDKPNDVSVAGLGAIHSQTLLVGNEGNFGSGTATLTQIDLSTNASYQNVYAQLNDEGIGDVLQSITRVGNAYYLVVNNSNKIIVTDNKMRKTSEIKNLNQARFMLAVNSNKAYVSSIYNYKIYVIDLTNNTKVNEINVDSNWTEEMVLLSDASGDYVYTCNYDTAINYITKINANTDQVVDRITIGGYAPSRIVKSTDNTLWILAGNNFFNKTATLTHLDPSNNQRLSTITFNPTWSPEHLAIDRNGDLLVLVNDYNNNKSGIYKVPKNATAAPSTFFITASTGTYLYGLGIEPVTNDIFVSDAKDFTQNGTVMRYNSNGDLIQSWPTGIAPSSFYFVQ